MSVVLYGDSTMNGAGATPGNHPAELLQTALDARFGPGAAQVRNLAVSGSTARLGITETGDVTVANWGVNDSTNLPIGEYRELLRGLPVTLFETPNPVVSTFADEANLLAFAQVMREVAAERRIATADTTAAVLAMPDWQSHFSDGFHHPDDDQYRCIVERSLAPAVVAQVEPLVCR